MAGCWGAGHEARHRARWRPLTEKEEAAALAGLRALAAGRPDLLAEVAGIFEGTSEGELDEPPARSAAGLCRLAGADESLIPQWVAEGRRRAEAGKRHRLMVAGPYNKKWRVSTAATTGRHEATAATTRIKQSLSVRSQLSNADWITSHRWTQ